MFLFPFQAHFPTIVHLTWQITVRKNLRLSTLAPFLSDNFDFLYLAVLLEVIIIAKPDPYENVLSTNWKETQQSLRYYTEPKRSAHYYFKILPNGAWISAGSWKCQCFMVPCKGAQLWKRFKVHRRNVSLLKAPQEGWVWLGLLWRSFKSVKHFLWQRVSWWSLATALLAGRQPPGRSHDVQALFWSTLPRPPGALQDSAVTSSVITVADYCDQDEKLLSGGKRSQDSKEMVQIETVFWSETKTKIKSLIHTQVLKLRGVFP